MNIQLLGEGWETYSLLLNPVQAVSLKKLGYEVWAKDDEYAVTQNDKVITITKCRNKVELILKREWLFHYCDKETI